MRQQKRGPADPRERGVFYAQGQPPAPVDAVVHFAAIPRVMLWPDNETFRVNVMGTYNIIEPP